MNEQKLKWQKVTYDISISLLATISIVLVILDICGKISIFNFLFSFLGGILIYIGIGMMICGLVALILNNLREFSDVYYITIAPYQLQKIKDILLKEYNFDIESKKAPIYYHCSSIQRSEYGKIKTMIDELSEMPKEEIDRISYYIEAVKENKL